MATVQSITEEVAMREMFDASKLRSEVESSSIEDKSKQNRIPDEDFEYIVGWKLHLITLGICLSLLVGQMESSIVSTSVLTITNELGGYDKSSWIFTAYLLTYSGMLIIWAKLSDIFGRKPLLTIAVFIFIVFSGACGASQTLTELIMFRWVQGIGGCGIYSIGTLFFFELVPRSKWAEYTALVTSVLALALAMGPLLGGAISQTTTWRWAFLLNIPIGAVSLVLLVFFLPRRLPNEPSARVAIAQWHGLSLRLLRKVDVLGALLLLGACILLATALLLAAQGASFAALEVLLLLIFSGLMWIGFVIWEWFITTKRSVPEPVFPWRFFQSRVSLGMILNTYFTGTIFTVCIVQIPQRFITVNGISPFQAGVRLLPFGVLVPIISTLAAMLMKKMVAPIYILVAGGILEVIGIICLSMISTSPEISASQYGFQILIGSGVGCFNAALILMVPFVMESRDLAVGTAAIAQFRVLGGILGLAIVTSVMNRWIRLPLLEILPSEQVKALLETTDALKSFPEATQLAVRELFGQGYNLQLKIMIGFAVAQIPATLMMWKKKPIMIK